MIRTEEIHFRMVRDDVTYGEIFAESSPTLRVNGNSEIKRSLQGTFLPYAVDDLATIQEIDWMRDEIKPCLIIDGVEYPLGILMPASITPTKSNGKTTLKIEAYDRCWRVRDYKVITRVSIAKGTKYTDAIESILAECGIARMVITPSELTFGSARDDWEQGTSYLSIVNELLGEMNYKSLWFDGSGTAIIEPASEPSVQYIKHSFIDRKKDPANEKEINMINIFPKVSKTTDIYQKPNVFVCICSNPDLSTSYTYRMSNRNPESPLSIQRRGRQIVDVEQVNNIASSTALRDYTRRKLLESMTTGEIIEFQTLLQPDFGVDDVCSIAFEDLSGICIEHEWEMHLTPGGTMSHKLERVVMNLD